MKKTSITVAAMLSTLGVTFVILKLLNIINWSWWLVTLPFWGLDVLIIIIAIIAFIIQCIDDFIILTVLPFLSKLKNK
jgi:Na+-transporting methylmalonyl-CoA/oxaloacetate decarboxylase gamma subunit